MDKAMRDVDKLLQMVRGEKEAGGGEGEGEGGRLGACMYRCKGF